MGKRLLLLVAAYLNERAKTVKPATVRLIAAAIASQYNFANPVDTAEVKTVTTIRSSMPFPRASKSTSSPATAAAAPTPSGSNSAV